MNIKQKFILLIATILIFSFTLVGVTYSYFINKTKKININNLDNNLYISYQDKTDLIEISNVNDSMVIYKYLKINSKSKLNYSIGLTTNYYINSFRDGITQEEVNLNPNLAFMESDGYYDNIFITMCSTNIIDENNLEKTFNNGKIVFKESNLIKDNKQILYNGLTNGDKYYILKLEYKNDPLLPVNNLSNVNILLDIYGVNVIETN